MAYELGEYYGGAAHTPFGRCKSEAFALLEPELRRGKGAYARFKPNCAGLSRRRVARSGAKQSLMRLKQEAKSLGVRLTRINAQGKRVAKSKRVLIAEISRAYNS